MQEEQSHAEAPRSPQSSPACCPSESLAIPSSALAKQAVRRLTAVRMSTARTSCCLHSYLPGESVTTPTACRFDRSIFEVILDRPDRQICQSVMTLILRFFSLPVSPTSVHSCCTGHGCRWVLVSTPALPAYGNLHSPSPSGPYLSSASA